MNFKKSVLKTGRFIILMTIEFEDFGLDIIILGEKQYGNILV